MKWLAASFKEFPTLLIPTSRPCLSFPFTSSTLETFSLCSSSPVILTTPASPELKIRTAMVATARIYKKSGKYSKWWNKSGKLKKYAPFYSVPISQTSQKLMKSLLYSNLVNAKKRGGRGHDFQIILFSQKGGNFKNSLS